MSDHLEHGASNDREDDDALEEAMCVRATALPDGRVLIFFDFGDDV